MSQQAETRANERHEWERSDRFQKLAKQSIRDAMGGDPASYNPNYNSQQQAPANPQSYQNPYSQPNGGNPQGPGGYKEQRQAVYDEYLKDQQDAYDAKSTEMTKRAVAKREAAYRKIAEAAANSIPLAGGPGDALGGGLNTSLGAGMV